MQYFKLFSAIVNLSLIVLALYFGLFKNEYAHASFLLLIAMINTDFPRTK
jgi:hypothetical protein